MVAIYHAPPAKRRATAPCGAAMISHFDVSHLAHESVHAASIVPRHFISIATIIITTSKVRAYQCGILFPTNRRRAVFSQLAPPLYELTASAASMIDLVTHFAASFLSLSAAYAMSRGRYYLIFKSVNFNLYRGGQELAVEISTLHHAKAVI